MWNLPPPPGFRGLDPTRPVTFYQRHLPHWRQDGATYFVTFRLADSLPQCKLDELVDLKREWERRHGEPRTHELREDLARRLQERVEHWLDQDLGSCSLKEPASAAFVVSALHHFDGAHYELGCYVVMPNHVHAIVRPLTPDRPPLEEIVGSWKKFSSQRIHSLRRGKGSLWQEECYDRIIRNEEHLWRVIQYLGNNPTRAKLPRESCPSWIQPQWVERGWRFD